MHFNVTQPFLIAVVVLPRTIDVDFSSGYYCRVEHPVQPLVRQPLHRDTAICIASDVGTCVVLHNFPSPESATPQHEEKLRHDIDSKYSRYNLAQKLEEQPSIIVEIENAIASTKEWYLAVLEDMLRQWPGSNGTMTNIYDRMSWFEEDLEEW